MQEKDKKSLNFWLTDKEFLSNSSFEDTYYLEGLCYKISSFLKNTPIHVVTFYDNKNKQIIFNIGENKKGFDIDIDVTYFDYITQVESWLKQFYPFYNTTILKEVELSDEEMKEKVKNGADLNDVLSETKFIELNKIGLIEKIYLRDDCFLLNTLEGKDGEVEKRSTVLGKSHFPLSVFMDKVRHISENSDLYNFIMEESKLVSYVEEKEIEITYSGKQMLNFFRINFENLKNRKLIRVNDFYYVWGRFKIFFNSLTLKDDCLKIYDKMSRD